MLLYFANHELTVLKSLARYYTVNNDNILSSFMDLDLYALAIKMIGDMCSSINNEKSNKDRKYIISS